MRQKTATGTVSYDADTMLGTSSRVYKVTSFGAGVMEAWIPVQATGEVVATFERSCYVARPDGRLVCIAGDRADDGPAMLKVDFGHPLDMDALGVKVGLPVYVQGGDLILGGHIRLRVADAIPWTPPAVGRSAPADAITRRLRTLVEDLTPFVPDSGLAPFVPHAEDLANGRPVQVGTQSQTASLALPRVIDIVRGLSCRDESEVDGGVRGLVGLGPGLTPSGDDFLGGMMIALRALYRPAGGDTSSCEADSDMHIMTSVLAECVMRNAGAGTTRISASHLAYAAEGVGTAAMHRLLKAILGADADADCSPAALRVAGVGHTSGWDCLAGLFVGIHVALISRFAHGLSGLRPSVTSTRHRVRA